MTGQPRDSRDYEHFTSLGCTEHEADLLVSAGVDPAVVGTRAQDAVPFVEAAMFNDLHDINGLLMAHGGDPDAAWQAWADEEEPSDED